MAILFGGNAGVREDSFNGLFEGLSDQFSVFSKKLSDGRPPVENVYVDDGFQNVPGTAFTGSGNLGAIDDIQKRRITTQAPDITVYIKKRIFWSLRNEHDTKFMGQEEKLFMKASKVLFERKCAQVAAYEAMTKLEKFAAEDVDMDVARIDALIELVSDFEKNVGVVEKGINDDFNAAATAALLDPDITAFDTLNDARAQLLAQLKKDIKDFGPTIARLNDLRSTALAGRSAVNTTWVVDTQQSTADDGTGRGTGVIEFTLIDSVQTNLSLNPGDLGGFSFTVQDPYNLLSIRSEDITSAILFAATEPSDDNSTSRAPQQILQDARDIEAELRTARNARFGFLDTSISPLSGADNSEIIFEINPGSLAANKVVGRVSSLSEPFTRFTYNLALNQLPLEQQLTFVENKLVGKIFNLLHSYIDSLAVAAGSKVQQDTTDATTQMRKHYLGKSIIQPMDGIHVYIRGNTAADGSVIGPLSEKLNGTSFISGFSSGKTTDDMTDAMIKEEMIQFNLADMSVDLYKSIRSSSLLRNAGMHVFGGLVSTVGESYSATNGTYTLSVSGESNMKWLDMSQVNTTPSLDQAQGVLEDPITPLTIDVDDATGLITGSKLSDENKRRIDAGILFYKDGVRGGEAVSEKNTRQNTIDYGAVSEVERKHAPGMMYKWKKGVIVATRDVNLRTTLNGSSSAVKKLRRDVGVNIIKDAFANLDVADVISLLVTGQPHNYETFLRNAQSIGTFTTGKHNNPESFFNSFTDITRSTNRALGAFEPMKFINVDRAQMAHRFSTQTELKNKNNSMSDKLAEIASIQDDINLLKSGNNEELRINAVTRLNSLVSELSVMNSALQESAEAAGKEGLRIYGNDVMISPDNDSAEVKRISEAAKLRTRFLQMRPQTSTKLNIDKNMFIVSDDYDKDLDLQAFAIDSISGEMPIWNSTYKRPREICDNAAGVIDFEFFCDSQGHIRLQSPKYNKIPLSLLAKMLLLGDRDSVDIMPPIIRNLFKSRAKGLQATIDVLKNEISVLGVLLFDDAQVGNKLKNIGQAGALFSDSVISQSAPGRSTTEVDNLNSRAEKIRVLRNEIARTSGTLAVSDSLEATAKIEEEIAGLNDPNTRNVNTKRLEKTNQMLKLSGQLQRAEDTRTKITDRQSELNVSLKNAKIGHGTTLLPGALSSIIEPFGDLIEDDFNDLLGPGSSQRFIIRDDVILSYDFKESDNNVFCRADVTGQIDLVGEGPGVIGGIPMIWAGATDFDLWKQYGYRPGPTTNKPFFKNAETQCAPYALMLLTRQHRDTVRANITVIGNEFYQIGDVVYINSRDMLYYVTSVAHNFSYSAGTFTTSLDLRYGHPLGEFIPTPLDVIGKNLIKNEKKFNTTFVHRSTPPPSAGRCIGVIRFNGRETDDLPQEMLGGDAGTGNLSELKNALQRALGHVDSKKFKHVEVRGFAKESAGIDVETATELVNARIAAVIGWLEKPISGYDQDKEEVLLGGMFKKLTGSQISGLRSAILLEVDEDTGRLKEEDIGRTPSEESYNILTRPELSMHDVVEIVMVFNED